MVDKNLSLVSVQPSSTSRWSSIWQRYNSLIVWLLLFAYLGIVAFLVTVVFPVQFLDRSQAGFFEAQGVIAIGVMGLIGVWISMYTGFPGAWDARISNQQRLLIPVIAGLLFGALFLATDLITGMSQLQQERFNVPSTDVPFPASLFFYSAASILVEVVFRLFPIPLLLGLASLVIRSARARESIFWMLAVLTSLIEPIQQSAGTQVLPPLAFAFVFGQTFGFNFFQAALFRKYGYLTSILARLAFYFIFHIIGLSMK